MATFHRRLTRYNHSMYPTASGHLLLSVIDAESAAASLTAAALALAASDQPAEAERARELAVALRGIAHHARELRGRVGNPVSQHVTGNSS